MGFAVSDTSWVEMSQTPDDDDIDDGSDVLSADDFRIAVTQLLLTTAPTLTRGQILDVRRRLVTFAKSHG